MGTKLVNGKRIDLTEEEERILHEEWEKEEKKKKQTEWLRNREKEYPPVNQQIEMMFNDLKNNGSIGLDGSWYKKIKKINDKYPEPKD